MKLSVESVGDFEKTKRWLSKVSNTTPTTSLNQIKNEAITALAFNTPKGETGQTSQGWRGKVVRSSRGAELIISNVAHPEAGVNIARLIHTGHGTGTGGYVPPRPYITQTMDLIFKRAGRQIAREMIK